MFEKKNQAAQPLWESGRPFLIAEIGKNFIQTKGERMRSSSRRTASKTNSFPSLSKLRTSRAWTDTRG